MAEQDRSHQAISAYFIGPKAENLDSFKENILAILEEAKTARLNYFQDDGEFISASIKSSDEFKRVTENFSKAVRKAANLMGKHSIPFWSPRYEAHMTTDLSMPSLLGYFMTMIYNPNNVAIEASPITTVAEIEVGEQLCNLFGYNIDPQRTDVPTGWGHVTCGGSVANLESIWVARNLKFYPLSLRMAIDKGELQFVADKFKAQTCQGERKLFKDMTTWELLNLRPKTVLDLPQAMNEQCGVSPVFLGTALEEYNIQTIGKDALERYFEISPEKPVLYMLGKTRHYSWPKGGAVTGIGSKNIIGIEVDNGARVDLNDLENHLKQCVKHEQAVYAIVAIIGSTEEGAVDRLSQILAMRQRFQADGLSFLVHADAAWGGYFATMLPRNLMDMPSEPGLANSVEGIDAGTEGFVPDLSLKVETQEDLLALRFADSITVDPHKAGYIPYPAGSLVYRDGRMKHLVTWTSPYLSRGSVTSIGVYGLEGSKPGAAAMSIWLSNKCIGLDQEGYGALLSEVSYTCAKLSAHWAAMTTDDDDFTCVPFHMLPSEQKPDASSYDIEREKERIRWEILTKTNSRIARHDADRPVEEKTMTLLRGLGSDLNINAFGLNFKNVNGEMNTDVEEANYFMQRVVERLSVDSPDDDPREVPFYLTSTEFSPELYGKCAENFKRRLGLELSHTSLFVLRNVVMSPFPTDKKFLKDMIRTFRDVVEDEVKICQKRNDIGPAFHTFIMQGTTDIFLIYRPCFHLAKHRRQLILRIELNESDRKVYYRIKKSNPEEEILLKTSQKISLDELLASANRNTTTFGGTLYTHSQGPINPLMEVTINQVVKDRPLSSMHRDPDYPSGHMPFYLFGSGEQFHISHMLLRSPNIILNAGDVKLEVKVWRDPREPAEGGRGLIAELAKEENTSPPVAFGTMELTDDVQIDAESVNKDIFKRVDGVSRWREEFDKVGRELKPRPN